MLVVYNKITKQVQTYFMSSCVEMTHDSVCPDKSHTEIQCFQVPDNSEIVNDYFLYTVNDTNPTNIILVKGKRWKFDFQCDKTKVSDRKYQMSVGDILTLPIEFKTEDNISVNPVGTFKIRASRGLLQPSQIVLDGTKSSVQVTWTPPQETINVVFSATLSSWNPNIVMDNGFLMTMELV